jgi:ribose transport system ATP-binding protein
MNLVSLRGVTKSFGQIRALDGVELTVRRGEVHGLVGANGSGKSTLVKILAGYHAADAGELAVLGEIATIHQDLGLVDELSVTENVIASTGFGGRRIAWREQHARVGALLARLGIDVDPRALVADIGRGERTLVAVARAICELEQQGDAHILITDEPTSALSSSEAGALWDLLRRVTESGGAVLFISHHLQEVRRMCDRVTVLRDGRVAAEGELTEQQMVHAMLGEAYEAPEPAGASAGDTVLRVDALAGDGLEQVSFEVRAGEIVGVTGLLGAGQERLPRLLAGHRPRDAGGVEIDGRALPAGNAGAALDAGLAFVPADRQREGLWNDGTVAENLGIVRAGRHRYDRGGEKRRGAALTDRFGVQPRDPLRRINELSGGNQQKVLLAKWLQQDPRVVVLHEPTQGVDVAAKGEIHRLLREFATARKAAVCIVSSDHEETADTCDRVLVMQHGRVTGELARAELSPQRILAMANA